MPSKKKESNIIKQFISTKYREKNLMKINNLEEIDIRNLYFETIQQIIKALLSDESKCINDLYEFISIIQKAKHFNVTSMKNDKRSTENKTNLVILCSKFNKPKILKLVLANQHLLRLFSNEEQDPLASDVDGENHNAFYYALRWNSVDLLKILFDDWPKDNMECLIRVLSETYIEIQLRRVPLATETKVYVETKLIDSHLNHSISSENIQPCTIEDRIELLTRIVNIISTQDSTERNVDDTFMYKVQFIAKNIHILKRQMTWTYVKLPWEEMEFCLVTFVNSHTTESSDNLFFWNILNKKKIIEYLQYFFERLSLEKDTIKTTKNFIDLSLERTRVMEDIIKLSPKFEMLYKDCIEVRNMYSLNKLIDLMDLALSADVKEYKGRLAIIRCLQLVGEYLKGTLMSPKLSQDVIHLLLSSTPHNTRKVLSNLRDRLSHSKSLAFRTHIEENNDILFMEKLVGDLRKIRDIMVTFMYNNKIRMIKELLKMILNSESLDFLTEYRDALKKLDIHGIYKSIEPNEIEDLVEDMKRTIGDMTLYEESLFNDVNRILKMRQNKVKKDQNNYISALAFLISISIQSEMNHMTDHNGLRDSKFIVNQLLRNFSSAESSELKTMTDVYPLLVKIKKSAECRLQSKAQDKMFQIFCKISMNCNFFCDNINWLVNLKEIVDKDRKKGTLPNNKLVMESSNESIVASHISCLKSLVNDTANKMLHNFNGFKKDKMVQAAVELLLLDILSFTPKSQKDYPFTLDEDIPPIIGTSLRNHLAHDNDLQYILPSDPTIAAHYFAVTPESLLKQYKVRKKSLSQIEDDFNMNLSVCKTQENMIRYIKEGNVEDLKASIRIGGDVFFKDNHLRTALHFAAKQPNVEMINYILELGVKIEDTDIYGLNPLHVAAKFGRGKIVDYLINLKDIAVDILSNESRTPLHYAALHGHKSVVQFLLNNNARHYLKDILGYSPIHYAIHNNHIDTVKVLLEKETDVDKNQVGGGYSSLHMAAERGLLNIVKLLLNKRANVNLRNDKNGTSIHSPALNGHFKVVQTLISHGADVNAVIYSGCTALHNAVEKGHENIVKLLIEKGADVNAKYKGSNTTPLHFAAQDGRYSIAKILLESEANVDALGSIGQTPLILAASNGHQDIIELLLKNRASIDLRDINNNTAVHLSCSGGHKESVRILLDHNANMRTVNTLNESPFLTATSEGKIDIVKMLIEKGINVNHTNNEGWSALHVSISKGYNDIAKLLIHSGADTDLETNLKLTPLHVATSTSDNLDILQLLLKEGKDVNVKSLTGLIPIHGAALNGNLQVVLKLIEIGADISATDKDGLTPLHFAILGNQKNIVQVLLQKGAKLDNTAEFSITPLSIAIKCNFTEIVDILIQKGADVNACNGLALKTAVDSGLLSIVKSLLKKKHIQIKPSLLHAAVFNGSVAIVEALLESGAEVDYRVEGVTPLIGAVAGRHKHIIEMLLKKGANINQKSSTGNSVLHDAVFFEYYDLIDLLLSFGADVDAVDYKNRTAFELAVAKNDITIVERFLQCKKIDTNKTYKDGWTVLHIAAQEGSVEKTQVLMSYGADIHIKNKLGSKPVHIAARDGHKGLVEYFLNNGINITDLGSAYGTLLHCAVIGGNVDTIQLLIDRNIDINAVNVQGSTAIHMCVANGQNSSNVVKILLKNGAVFNASDIFKKKPIDNCMNEQILTMFSTTEELFSEIKSNNPSKVKKLVAEGAFLDALNVNRVTPLHSASCKGSKEIVDCLLSAGANPNVLGKGGSRPLHYASKFNHIEIVFSLLGHGAMYNILDDNQKSPEEYTTCQDIKKLLKLVDESFVSVQSGNCQAVEELNKIKDRAFLRAVFNARNKQDKSLIVVALQNDFPLVKKLKQIPVKSISTQLKLCDLLFCGENYNDALHILNDVLEEAIQFLEAYNPIVLDIQIRIAKILHKQTKYFDALKMYEDIIKIYKSTFGEDHSEVWKIKSAKALIYHRLARNNEALQIYEEILGKQMELLGENHEDTLDTQFHLALVLDALKRYDEALDMNRRVYEKWKQICGIRDLTTISAKNNIAMVLMSQDKLEEALEEFRQVHDIRMKVLGAENSNTLRSLHNVASVLMKQQKFDEAFELHQKVYNVQKRILGPTHHETLQSKCFMGSSLFLQKKYLNALKIYNEGLDQIKNALGSKHPMVSNIEFQIVLINQKLKFEMQEDFLFQTQVELFSVVSNGDIAKVKELIKSGVDVNTKDQEGRTALHFAVENNHKNIIDYLLTSEADIKKVTKKGNSSLHTAVARENTEIGTILLVHARDSKYIDVEKFVNLKTVTTASTCLHVAVKKSNFDLVKLLLSFGAHYNCKDNLGKTPNEHCKQVQISNLLKLISRLFDSAVKGDTDIFRNLNTLPQDEIRIALNALNEDNRTPIQVALSNSQKKFANCLVNAFRHS